MGIYPQPNLWQCGPFALKHALIALGLPHDEGEITHIAGTRWWQGTDEIQLGRAARRFGCTLHLVRRRDPLRARRELLLWLKRGLPVLLCVDQWSHWITVVKAEAGKYIILDSHERRVLAIADWATLRRRWAYREDAEVADEEPQHLYDLHPVVPRRGWRMRAHFSLARVRALRLPKNRQIAARWDAYLEDLLAFCSPRSPRSERVVSLGEFFRRHGSMLVEEVDYWHGALDRDAARRILDDLHFVADTYGLVVPEESEKRAIAGLTALLAMWAAGEYGVSRVYHENGRRHAAADDAARSRTPRRR